ncbi:MAG: D-arabinono-1,4-lactone oxidase [Rhizobiaceae bacterium]
MPRARFNDFIADARAILKDSGLAVLNASVRIVHGDDIALTYAPRDAFSLVLYINQSADEAGNAAMRAATRRLVDAAIAHGGRFFLPYQLHYTGKQLLASYPEITSFLAKKREVDPDGLFTSTWYRAVSGLVGST